MKEGIVCWAFGKLKTLQTLMNFKKLCDAVTKLSILIIHYQFYKTWL